MEDQRIQQERAQNLWTSLVRKFPSLAKGTAVEAAPQVGTDRIGGLAQAQEELLTYGCAMTDPEVYARWGTVPPTGVLLIGPPGSGKRLLTRALATRARTAFLSLDVPQLVLEIVHRGGKVGELLDAWGQFLQEFPPVTVFFQELEFSQAQEIGARRPDLPIGPIMDFLLDLVDRSVGIPQTLVVGSTMHPDTLRPAFFMPGRFERMVEVTPVYPDDVIAALGIHARSAEKSAGRTLFEDVDWEDVVRRYRDPSIGDWIRLMHGALRRKARCEASAEEVGPVRTEDMIHEVERFRRVRQRLPRTSAGTYV
jgi:ATP-dependent 26S proteasome regulatory subunit